MAADKSSSETASSNNASSSGDYQDIVVTDSGGARTILLDRPHKYNAITLKVPTMVHLAYLLNVHIISPTQYCHTTYTLLAY